MSMFGAMLDCSRNRALKEEEVEKFASYLHDFGYNTLMLYCEDTYLIPDEPYFGMGRAGYSQEELKKLDSYCASLDIELIPCVELLGHMGSMLSHGKYASMKDTDSILLVGEEETYAFIEKILRNARECFHTDKIHIGLDEAWTLGTGRYLEKHGYRSKSEIMKEHLSRVVPLCKKYGFTPMMWDDMFYKNGDGKGEEALKEVDPSVELVYWDYFKKSKAMYADSLKKRIRTGKKVIYAGGVWTWVGFCPDLDFAKATMEDALDACKENGVDDILMTLWGDDGGECSPFSALPLLYELKRYFDGEKDLGKIKEEFASITGEDYDSFFLLSQMNAPLGVNPRRLSNTAKWAFYNDPFTRKMDTHVKEGGKEAYMTLEKELGEAAKKSPYFSSLFASASFLAHFLTFKYDLGVRTYEAYRSKDKKKLETVLAQYEGAVHALKEFYEVYRNLWLSENKPQGFDVQDFRMGGLLMRLEDCRRRLEDFASGKASSIPELERPPLEEFPDDGDVCCNAYGFLSSPNAIVFDRYY